MEKNRPWQKAMNDAIARSQKLGDLYRNRTFLDYLRSSRVITQGVRDILAENEPENP